MLDTKIREVIDTSSGKFKPHDRCGASIVSYALDSTEW